MNRRIVALWLLLLISLTLLIRTGYSHNNLDDKLYFLNNPESVLTTGTLARIIVPNNTRSRFFFHYKNATGKPQLFYVKNNVLADVRIGYAVSDHPDIAGRDGAAKFLSANNKRLNINIKCSLKENQTVSGIIECSTKQLSVFTFYIGNDSVNVAGACVLATKNRVEYVSLNEEAVKIGTRRKEHIDGDYGTSFLISNIGHKTHLEVSPRGGDVHLVYKINKKVIQTKLIKAYSTYYIPIGIDQIELIPVGGVSYPLRLTMK